MIKLKLSKPSQKAVVEKITGKHLKSVIDVIKTAPPCPTNDDYVEFELSCDDAEKLTKEISIIASRLDGMVTGNLWRTYDYISDCLRESKGKFKAKGV